MVRVLDAATGRVAKAFTCVEPTKRATSVAVYFRDGWDELRRALLPRPGEPARGIPGVKQRCGAG